MLPFENIYQIYILVLFYIYIYAYAYTHIYMHTCIHTRTHALTHTHICFNVSQMSMNVQAVDILATVQLHVSTLLDPTHVPVTIVLQEVEKLAT